MSPASAVAEFLPPYHPQHAFIRGDKPMAQGTAVLGGGPYSYFRYQQHRAQENALAVHEEIADEFAARFGRHYGLVEAFQLEDATMSGDVNAFATKGKAAVQRWRQDQSGLLPGSSARSLWPRSLPRSRSPAVAVIDQNLARSRHYAEIATARIN
jgi:pyruvate ferredoxin oxidoreductase alpha subunit